MVTGTLPVTTGTPVPVPVPVAPTPVAPTPVAPTPTPTAPTPTPTASCGCDPFGACPSVNTYACCVTCGCICDLGYCSGC